MDNTEMITKTADGTVQILLYVGGVICSALVSVIVVLWNKLDSTQKYIMTKEREELLLYTAMQSSYEKINQTLNKLNETTMENLKPLLIEIKDKLLQFTQKK